MGVYLSIRLIPFYILFQDGSEIPILLEMFKVILSNLFFSLSSGLGVQNL